MTMPLRTAPPPPSTTSQPSSRQTSMRHQATSHHRSQNSSPLWSGSNNPEPETRKAPPPRPPPPKLAPLSKSTSNVFGNLFGKSKSNGGNSFKHSNYSSTQPFSLPPPPGPKSNHHHHQNHQQTPSQAWQLTFDTPTELISFDSPPNSPKPNAKPSMNVQNAPNYTIDLLSSDPPPLAFGQSSSSSSSTAAHSHSGFEDSFAGGWDASDPFSPLPTTMPTFEPTKQSTQLSGTAHTARAIPSDFLDPLCNGKSLLPPQPVITMPTIIKPVKPPPNVRPLAKLPTPSMSSGFGSGTDMTMSSSSSVSSSLSSSSHNMPNEESHAMVLFDFQALQDGDLNLRTNEKVYLLRQINEDWYFGRKKSGQEGVFPASYVDVKVPLRSQESHHPAVVETPTPSPSTAHAVASDIRKARVAFVFTAQTNEDLTLREQDIVTVLYAINDDWWFGEIGHRRGQFPSAFVEII